MKRICCKDMRRNSVRIISLFMLAILFFFFMYIVAESVHICEGDGCTICRQIEFCEQTILQVASGSCFLIFCFCKFIQRESFRLFYAHFAVVVTPVRQKVRMND